MNKKVLKSEYQDLEDEFYIHFSDTGCTCRTSNPPCSWCTHEGNPLNLQYDDNAWDIDVLPDYLFIL